MTHRPTHMPGCSASKCPRCGTESPCVDHLEVDIGIGIQTAEHKYWCEMHGEFAFSVNADFIVTPIFEDDQLS